MFDGVVCMVSGTVQEGSCCKGYGCSTGDPTV
jgi:hypothetical protein